MISNRLRELRKTFLISKSELARKAGVAQLTIDRVERGLCCRNETKRKILAAFGLQPWEKDKIFPQG